MKSHQRLSSTRWLIAFVCCLVVLTFVLRPTQGVGTSLSQNTVTLVNAASYDRVIAPGAIVALFGANLTSQLQVASELPLPTVLAGVTVKINGIAAPLFFASAGQINLQAPNGVNPGTANVEVVNAGSNATIASGSVTVAESAPGVFTNDLSGRGQAVALNSDFSRNADFDRLPGSRPEASGAFLIIYATGIGRTNPLVADGHPAPDSPLAQTTGTTTVTVGGAPAQVLFSGLAPGFVGLWQLNVVLPANLPTNLATPLRVELNGRQSLETTLAIINRNEVSNLAGVVLNAVNGAPIGGANVTLQQDASGRTRAAVTDAQGRYNFTMLAPGNYTLTASSPGFLSAAQGATIVARQSLTAPPFALTPPLGADQYRLIVSWQNGIDLDAHLTGPAANNSRFHIWWNGETDLATPATAQFDRDDLTGAGPETVTFKAQANGVYRFSVQNYTDRDADGSLRMTQSKATVRVYRGDQQIALMTAPGGGGTLWKVFEISNGQLRAVNQLSDEPDPSRIKTIF